MRHCDHLFFSHLSQFLLTSRCFPYRNWHILQWECFRRVLDMPYTQRLAFVILFDGRSADLHMVIKGGHVRGLWNPRCENEWPAFRTAVCPFSSPLHLLGFLILQSCLPDKFYSFLRQGLRITSPSVTMLSPRAIGMPMRRSATWVNVAGQGTGSSQGHADLSGPDCYLMQH